ncbi:MAG: hypothetical protein AB7P76_10485 [Candidatus Melainabacteria bacterium]
MDPALLTIPAYQPIPFPAPLWLLKTLLVVTFLLHVIPMNVALGGSFVSGLLLALSGGDRQTFAGRFGHALAVGLPVFVSFALTFGVAPLLFLQLVYGPMYYTSSLLMAAPWLGVLLLVMGGYYGCYIYKLNYLKLGARAGWLMIGVSVLFALVALTFTSNMVFMLSPEKWQAVLAGNLHGLYFYWEDPQQLPRYLHFVLAALAVTGLAMGCFGLYWHGRERAYGEWLIKTGAGVFGAITLVQVGVGGWFLMSLPHATMMNFMGGDTLGTAVFGVAMLCSVVALLAAVISWKDGRPGPMKIAVGAAVLVIGMMSWMRHLLREYTIGAVIHPELVPVKTQWDLLIVFVLSAVALIVYLVWLARVAWQGLLNDAPASQP